MTQKGELHGNEGKAGSRQAKKRRNATHWRELKPRHSSAVREQTPHHPTTSHPVPSTTYINIQATSGYPSTQGASNLLFLQSQIFTLKSQCLVQERPLPLASQLRVASATTSTRPVAHRAQPRSNSRVSQRNHSGPVMLDCTHKPTGDAHHVAAKIKGEVPHRSTNLEQEGRKAGKELGAKVDNAVCFLPFPLCLPLALTIGSNRSKP